jgi:putative Mg2+ transporter-C (MgtC) family protein
METEILLKIILAAFLGGIIGLEREIANKEAGLRTNILIGVGSCLITILSLKISTSVATADPARLAAQIVSGIGFLGAGAIIQARFAVHGLTTAATIWTVSAIGISVGVGFYLISFLVTLLVVIILRVFRLISKVLEKQKKTFAYIVNVEDRASIIVDIKKIMIELGIKYVNMNLAKVKDGFEIELLLDISHNKDKEFVEQMMQLPGIKEVSSESL